MSEQSRRAIARLDAAENWISTVRDELVLAGFPAGDRTVALQAVRKLLDLFGEMQARARADGQVTVTRELLDGIVAPPPHAGQSR